MGHSRRLSGSPKAARKRRSEMSNPVGFAILTQEEKGLAEALGLAIARYWNKVPVGDRQAIISAAANYRPDPNPSMVQRLEDFTERFRVKDI
jgi:hypothetical protein